MTTTATTRPTINEVSERMTEWVLHPDYPCLGARAVFNRERAHIITTGRLGLTESSIDVFHALDAFTERFDPSEGLCSLVVAFADPAPTTEQAFEKGLWRTLQHLTDFDETPWHPEVSSDPDDAEFSFSVAGTAYFVVGLHPNASRQARRSPWPVLVFNLHSQFVELRESGRFEHMRDVIRGRDTRLQGSVNPMVADYGQSSEARQYSGRAVPPSWQAPLEATVSADMAGSNA